MVNESYIEVMVKRKTAPLVKVRQLVAAVITVFCGCLALIGLLPALIGVLAAGAAAYYLSLLNVVEYEYTYVDKELQIDRILGRSKRKRMETLDLMQMELLAPLSSHQLDAYRNKNQKNKDYSSGEIKQPETRYLLCMKDRQLIIEPGERLVKMIQSVAPRKVFTY